QQVTCEASGQNLSHIPTNLLHNLTKLSLKHNKISLHEADQELLESFLQLTELSLSDNTIPVLYNHSFSQLAQLLLLDLSHNRIRTVHAAAFAGLKQLSLLNLSHNSIAHLESEVWTSLKSLTVLDLQSNFLSSLHMKSSLPLRKINLAGNPLVCSCDLLRLQRWLTASNVTMEHKINTTCVIPSSMGNISIPMADLHPFECQGEQALENTPSPTPDTKAKSSALLTTPTPNNTMANDTTHAEFPHLGKSWTFLAGVLGFVLGTTLLIFTAIKCPSWYHYVVSYSHQRLQEHDSEMLQEEFSADIPSSPARSRTKEEDPIVIFEKIHPFVPGEDGFIEDKYIEPY
ncbi:LRC19 protein, partial [Bucco capensis]|nr:LRC19 protein [Bucco capensis]